MTTMQTNVLTDPIPPEDLSAAVFRALGAASVCWDHMEGTGVFHSERAKAIGEDLIAYIEDREPLLGFATTRQLLDELRARGEVDAAIGQHPIINTHMANLAKFLLNALPDASLAYRTVDG